MESTKDVLPTLYCTRNFLWMSIVFLGIFPGVVEISRRDSKICDRVSSDNPSGVFPAVLPGVLQRTIAKISLPRELLDLLGNFQDNLIEASRTNYGRDSARHFGRHPGKRSMRKYLLEENFVKISREELH